VSPESIGVRVKETWQTVATKRDHRLHPKKIATDPNHDGGSDDQFSLLPVAPQGAETLKPGISFERSDDDKLKARKQSTHRTR